jgi:predicted transcriptional regulator
MRSPSLNVLTGVNASCKDLFTCLYDLSASDITMLTALLRENKPKTLDELAKIVDRDRGTAFRTLQKLVSIGFCIKETMTLKEGGYYHLYRPARVDDIEKRTEQRVREIQQSLDLLIKKFRQDIKQMTK